jgi:hypothetical protein
VVRESGDEVGDGWENRQDPGKAPRFPDDGLVGGLLSWRFTHHPGDTDSI